MAKAPAKPPQRRPKRNVGEAIVAISGAAAASTVGDPSAVHAAAWGAAAVGPVVWNYFVGKFAEWNAQRQRKLFEAFAGPDGDAEAVRLLVELEEAGWAKEAIFSTLRQVSEAIDEAVIPVLGVLLRDYLGAGKRIDWFFRAVQRVFVDLTADELLQIKKLLSYLATTEGDDSCALNVFVPRPPAEQRLSGLAANAGNPLFRNADPPVLPDAVRLFQVLRTHQLAFETGRLPPMYSLAITLKTVRQLQRLITLAESGWPT